MAATNRRQLLTGAAAYAAGAAIVAGGAALASEPKGAAPAISPGLSRLLSEHARADAVLNAWYEAVWNPAVASEWAQGGRDQRQKTSALRVVEDEYWAPVHAANEAIFAFPVASVTDAVAKLEHLGKMCGEDSDRTFQMVHADLARLAGEVQA